MALAMYMCHQISGNKHCKMLMCIWTAEVYRFFICEREPLNLILATHVVVVLKDDVVIGHLATMTCTVIIVYTEKW